MELIKNNLTGDILVKKKDKTKQLYKDQHGYFIKSDHYKTNKTVERFTKEEENYIKDFITII